MATKQAGKQDVYEKRNIWSGLLFGIGAMAVVDEVIFHQLLQWHHFYDLSTPAAGIVADGLLNSFAWVATVGGLFLLADLRRRQAFLKTRWIGALCAGAGGFQLFDGSINHKVLRVHQIRYNVELFPYDLFWNVFGGILLLAGLYLIAQSRKGRKAE